MWDKLLGSWVEKHLGTYFKNLDVHKFRLDLGKGDLKLGPLELRPEAFLHSENPVEVRAGYVGSLRVSFPKLTEITSAPLTVELDALYLLIGLPMRTLKPVETTATLGSGSAPPPSLPQPRPRAPRLILGSAPSRFEATSQPSSGPPKAADLRANPLPGKQWSEAQKAEEAQARRARHQAAITAAEQLLQRLQQASSLEGLAAAAGLKKTAAFFREDTFLTRQVSARTPTLPWPWPWP